MAANFDQKDRHVVPRWRDAQTTGVLGELDPASTKLSKAADHDYYLGNQVTDWQQHREIGFAADLVGAALAIGEFEQADEAARFILSDRSRASDAIKAVAARVIGTEPPKAPRPASPPEQLKNRLEKTVKLARLRLREDPRNAIAWTDLARAYVSLGEDIKAGRAMSVAVSLGRLNRFILRSASRLHIHGRRADKAHDLLRRNEATKYDPWLVAAEIAAGDLAGRTSKSVKIGMGMLKSGHFHPFHLAELATALGMLELKAGASKSAHRLFQTALLHPTENSLAQIEWASKRVQGLIIEQQKFELPFSHEAKARYSFNASDWERMVSECISWLADEPFSSQPAALGSCVAAEQLEDFLRSEKICHYGLISNPNDATLLNNLAYALAQLGRIKEAQETLDKITSPYIPESTQICRLATQGLIHFRTGDPVRGRESYQAAISRAAPPAFATMRARASINLAREEVRIDSDYALSSVADTIRWSKSIAGPDLQSMLERLKAVLVQRADPSRNVDRILTDLNKLLERSKPPLPPEKVPMM